MKTITDIVPRWVRIVVALFAFANITFGISGYVDPSALFQNYSTGIDLTGLAAKYASYEFAARNLAVGLALMIAALKGVPESITIVTIIRVFIELQTMIVAVLTNNVGVTVVVPAVFLALKLLIVKTMVGVIQQRDALT
ncbi:MAG: hypothetical protein WCW40_13055 [Bacteroidota bacterium]